MNFSKLKQLRGIKTEEDLIAFIKPNINRTADFFKMSTEEVALRAACCNNVLDMTARLVLADFLEEQSGATEAARVLREAAEQAKSFLESITTVGALKKYQEVPELNKNQQPHSGLEWDQWKALIGVKGDRSKSSESAFSTRGCPSIWKFINETTTFISFGGLPTMLYADALNFETNLIRGEPTQPDFTAGRRERGTFSAEKVSAAEALVLFSHCGLFQIWPIRALSFFAVQILSDYDPAHSAGASANGPSYVNWPTDLDIGDPNRHFAHTKMFVDLVTRDEYHTVNPKQFETRSRLIEFYDFVLLRYLRKLHGYTL